MMADQIKRAVTGLMVAGWILFVGHMCGALITQTDYNNALPYIFATFFGGFAWIQPWRFGA